MYYDCLGDNTYKVTLKIYRDCYSEGAEFDDPLYLYVYNSSGILQQEIAIALLSSTYIDPDLTNPCIVDPPDICVEEGIYETIINLPDSYGGYDLVYQRCCRNSSIVNLDVPDSQGATYWAHIPDPGEICNSSPRFTAFPPVIICGGYAFEFDHSAIDPDGDSLVYALCDPFLGGSITAPIPTPDTEPPVGPPPFSTLDYATGYSATYPMDASPEMAIDAATGLITGTPTAFGQFVVGICIQEFRDGVLIETHLRDFQFNVTDCTPALYADFPEEINNCDDLTIHFDNNSYGTDSYYWDFGVTGIASDVSTVFEPEYTYPDTGTYTVMLVANPGTLCADTMFSEVQIYPHLHADFNYEAACARQLLYFDDASVTDHGVLDQWIWDFGGGHTSTLQNPSQAFETAGTFPVTLKVKNDVGCTKEITKYVTVYPAPQAEFTWDNHCLGQTANLMDNSSIPDIYSVAAGEWYLPGEATATDGLSTSLHFDTAGVYEVTYIAISDKGCSDTVTHYITVAPHVVAELQADTTICVHDTVQLMVRNGSEYQWTPVYNISDANAFNPYVYPEVSTLYTVNVSDGCTSDTTSVFIEVLPEPVITAWPDTAVYRYEPVQLSVESDAVAFSWWPETDVNNPGIAEPTAYPSETSAFIVTATGANGCTNTDTISIVVWYRCDRFEIPNAFSPNGDGLNDVFRIVTFGDDAVENFSIFNRWGQRVFETDNIVNAWDGSCDGKDQETGVYFYIIKIQCEGERQTLSGTVTLLR